MTTTSSYIRLTVIGLLLNGISTPGWSEPGDEPLCRPLEFPAGKVGLGCRLERGSFRDETAARPAEAAPEISVVAYNLNRGLQWPGILDLFTRDPEFSKADLILLNEVDRGCARSGSLNQARRLAALQGLEYVFAVEFVERGGGAGGESASGAQDCEHGNAILSRLPIQQVWQVVHSTSDQRYGPPFLKTTENQERIGGRVLLAADVELAGETVRVFSLHFASGVEDNPVRTAQAAEVVQQAATFEGPVIAGGDLNSAFYIFDVAHRTRNSPAVSPFLEAGFKDAHAGLPHTARGTSEASPGILLLLDLVLVRGFDSVRAGVCSASQCGSLSDHLPVWARLKLTRP